MTTLKEELNEALLSQFELTGQELSLEDATAYVSGMTKALLLQANRLEYDLDAEDAERIVLALIGSVDFTNPAVTSQGFDRVAKLLLPRFIKQREEVKKWINEVEG